MICWHIVEVGELCLPVMYSFSWCLLAWCVVETQRCCTASVNYIRQIASKANSANSDHDDAARNFQVRFHPTSSHRNIGKWHTIWKGQPSVHRSCIILHWFQRYADLVSAKWCPFRWLGLAPIKEPHSIRALCCWRSSHMCIPSASCTTLKWGESTLSWVDAFSLALVFSPFSQLGLNLKGVSLFPPLRK